MRAAERAAAIAAGAKTYFTGKPCKKGHVAERRCPGGECVECARLRFKQFYHANREREIARVGANPEAVSAARKARRLTNPEMARERDRVKRARDPEAASERTRQWRANNPQKVIIGNRANKARRMGAEGRHTQVDLDRIYLAQGGKCAACQVRIPKTGAHVDHIIALSRGGSNWPRNLQYLCPPCNLAKWAKDPIDFARTRGMLL